MQLRKLSCAAVVVSAVRTTGLVEKLKIMPYYVCTVHILSECYFVFLLTYKLAIYPIRYSSLVYVTVTTNGQKYLLGRS